MIQSARRWVTTLVFVGVALGVAAAPRTEHVFVISIDGGNPEVMHRSEMPVFKKLVREGAHTWSASTIHPCLTLPAHTSMLTGMFAEGHGITWNNYRPTNGVVKVPTVFNRAKRSGLSTAMFVGKEKFRQLLQPGTVDEFNYDSARAVIVMKSASGDANKEQEGNVMAKVVATNAANYILKHQPKLCFIHFTDPDTIGHESGWGSPEQRKAFADADEALGLILQAIRQAGVTEKSVVIVTADHGGHGKGHSQGLPEDMTIPWVAWGQGVKKGSTIGQSVNTCDTASTVLWLLGLKSAQKLDGDTVRTAFDFPEAK